MSELNTTPGPWTVHHRMRDCVTFEGKFGTENLFLENLEGYYACQSEPDAYLIAAAPELYEALDQAVTSMQDSGYRNDSVVVIAAKDALAKARGES